MLSNVDPDKIQLPEGALGKSSVCASQQHPGSVEHQRSRKSSGVVCCGDGAR
jgi:hypothetical protein